MDKKQLLDEVAEKLKGRELFPESNARAKEMLSRVVWVGDSPDNTVTEKPETDEDREANDKID